MKMKVWGILQCMDDNSIPIDPRRENPADEVARMFVMYGDQSIGRGCQYPPRYATSHPQLCKRLAT